MSSNATSLYGTKIMGSFHALSIINERRRALAVIGCTCRALKTSRIFEKDIDVAYYTLGMFNRNPALKKCPCTGRIKQYYAISDQVLKP